MLSGLIGYNISGSLSQKIHETEANALGFELNYRIIDCNKYNPKENVLKYFLEKAELLEFSGLNITHPYKEEAFTLMDEISEEAKNIGAINTLIFKNNKRFGHNTDWFGFKEAFFQNLKNVPFDTVALIGCGGAGKAVAYAILQMGAKQLRLYDKFNEKSVNLFKNLQAQYSDRNIIICDNTKSLMDNVDGLIQATPIGMQNYPGMPISSNLITANMWVYDLIYFPKITELLKTAKQKGCKILSGEDMVVYQAAASFKLLYNIQPDISRMLYNFNK